MSKTYCDFIESICIHQDHSHLTISCDKKIFFFFPNHKKKNSENLENLLTFKRDIGYKFFKIFFLLSFFSSWSPLTTVI